MYELVSVKTELKNDTLVIASLESIRFPKHFRRIWLIEMIKSEGNVSFAGRYISEVC